MNITPETKKLSSLFGLQLDDVYKVPEYQRGYSWREKQIETLFNDIYEEQEGYYLGNLLLLDSGNGEYHVIDGQQRLTTISMFLLAIYEIAQNITSTTNSSYNSILYRTTGDIERMLITPKSKVRLTLLDHDHKIWSSLLLILKEQTPGKFGKWSFYKRYKFIKESLFDKISEPDELIRFYDNLINVELLNIKVTNLSDAYNAFSSLNSKGLPLTQLDLLKVTYLKKSFKV